jgi:eukaryotic-like serine/threonine-protein kinase
MANDRGCRRCGKPRPSDVISGICPFCLLNAALDPGPAAVPLDDSRGDEVTLALETTSPGRILVSLARSIGSIPRVLLPDTRQNDDGQAIIKPSSPEMPAPSERGDRYQLFGEIARGGMGAVLMGRDPDLGRDLALKVLLEGHRDNPDLLRRFVEEAQIGGQLQHPGIVPVYELGTFADSRPYFTMKLVKGRTLAALLRDRQNLHDDLPRFLGILEQVCQTVAYAHSRGVIHRDLKPANLMVGSFGEVQVMDWGLAKVLKVGGQDDEPPAPYTPAAAASRIRTVRSGSGDGDSQAGSVLGTPAYMAPEQAGGDNERVDRRADVFGLGSILCEVLTGRPAYTGRNQSEVMGKAMRGEMGEALARLDGCGAHAELIGLAKDCLAPERDDRPTDARAVADRLIGYHNSVHQRLHDAELAKAAESARAEEAKRTAAAEAARAEAALAGARAERRARRLQAGLAASLIAMMALSGGGYAWNQRQRDERAARAARAIDVALSEAAHLMVEARAVSEGESARWVEARSAAERAEGLLAQGEPNAVTSGRVAAMRAQIEREWSEARDRSARLAVDRALVAELESVRGDRAVHDQLQRINAAYAAAFRRAGLDFLTTEPAEAGRWIASRSESRELAGYLDDWAWVSRRTIQTGQNDWHRLIAAARVADPDPWRDALRARLGMTDETARNALSRLADDASALDRQPPAGLVLLARELADYGGDDSREQVVRVLRRASSRHPDDFWAHFELARVSFAAKPTAPQLEEAIRHLTAATAIRPGSASAHYHLGLALNGQKSDEALTEFRRALQLKPDSYWAQSNLCEALEARGEIEQEIAACRVVVRLDPEDAWGHANLAGALKADRQIAEAIAEFGRAIRLEPKMLLAHVELGGCLWSLERFAEASVSWREAIRLDPDDALMYVNLGQALRRQGKLDESIAEYRNAIRLDPNKVSFHLILAGTIEEQGRHDEALAVRREAIRLQTGRRAAPAGFDPWLGAPDPPFAMIGD